MTLDECVRAAKDELREAAYWLDMAADNSLAVHFHQAAYYYNNAIGYLKEAADLAEPADCLQRKDAEEG